MGCANGRFIHLESTGTYVTTASVYTSMISLQKIMLTQNTKRKKRKKNTQWGNTGLWAEKVWFGAVSVVLGLFITGLKWKVEINEFTLKCPNNILLIWQKQFCEWQVVGSRCKTPSSVSQTVGSLCRTPSSVSQTLGSLCRTLLDHCAEHHPAFHKLWDHWAEHHPVFHKLWDQCAKHHVVFHKLWDHCAEHCGITVQNTIQGFTNCGITVQNTMQCFTNCGITVQNTMQCLAGVLQPLGNFSSGKVSMHVLCLTSKRWCVWQVSYDTWVLVFYSYSSKSSHKTQFPNSK